MKTQEVERLKSYIDQIGQRKPFTTQEAVDFNRLASQVAYEYPEPWVTELLKAAFLIMTFFGWPELEAKGDEQKRWLS